MKKIISITIAILLMIPQQALCLRPKAAKLAGTAPGKSTTELVPTFTVPLTPEREEALQYLETGEAADETISRLINSKDIAVFLSYLYSIPKYKRKIPENTLDVIYKIRNPDVRTDIAKTLGAIGGVNVLDVFKEWIERGEQDPKVRYAILETLGIIGAEVALSALKKQFDEQEDFDITLFVIKEVLGAVGGEKAVDIILQEWLKQEDDFAMVRFGLAKGLSYIGREVALFVCKKWIEKGEEKLYVYYAIAKTLGIIGGADAFRVLTEWNDREENEWVRNGIEQAIRTIESKEKGMDMPGYDIKSLISWEGASSIDELKKRKRIFQDVAGSLSRGYDDEFTGLIVFGSMHKGYLASESDADLVTIGTNSRLTISTKDELANKGLNIDLYLFCNLNDLGVRNARFLFHAMFFGNRNRLTNIQRQTLSQLDEKSWKGVLSYILEIEISLKKLFERSNITDISDQCILKAYRFLHRLPLPLDEMKKAMGVPADLTTTVEGLSAAQKAIGESA